MRTDLKTRNVDAFELLKILEEHLGERVRLIVPLWETGVTENFSTVTIGFKGIRVVYDDPMTDQFEELMRAGGIDV